MRASATAFDMTAIREPRKTIGSIRLSADERAEMAQAANTESNGRYQDHCRRHGLPIHLARFPNELPEYFIRLLTNPGDRVLDPFAGSCVTGAAAEQLGRHWICCEQNEDYLKGALARFQDECGPASKTADLFPDRKATPVGKKSFYTINPPCSVPVDETSVALVQDGGLNRPAPHFVEAANHFRGWQP